MGVRFACHACGKRLNIKSELAGRRGICPSCSVRFRIPIHDTEISTPIHSPNMLDDSESSDAVFTAGEDDRLERRRCAASAAATRADTLSPQPIAARSTSPAATLDEVLGGAAATWYVRPPSGGQYGPADGLTLGQWIEEGRVSETAMLWRDGWPDWKSAKQVLPIFTTAQNGASSSAQPPPSGHGSAATGAAQSVAIDQQANTSSGDSAVGLRTGKKVLPTNKKKMSRKRVAISVMLACILVVLAVALILVLNQSA